MNFHRMVGFSQLFSPYYTNVVILGLLREVVSSYPGNGVNLRFHRTIFLLNVTATLQIPPKVPGVIHVHGRTDTVKFREA